MQERDDDVEILRRATLQRIAYWTDVRDVFLSESYHNERVALAEHMIATHERRLTALDLRQRSQHGLA